MILTKIQLINFRNYSDYKLDFAPITVFIGRNGIGKSNIIEAISMLSIAKSYRTRDERNLINYNTEYAQIIGTLKKDKLNFVIEKNQNKLKKQVRYNQIDKKLSELFGILKTVLFTPDSLKIVTGSPTTRRKFLDIIVSQIDKKYINTLIEYKKIIKQKNELLSRIKKQLAQVDELDFWNSKLANLTKIIVNKRSKLINFINKNIQSIYDQIGKDNKKDIKIKYKTKFDDTDKISEIYCSYIEREIFTEKCLVGAHLDDMQILINKKNANDIASRGEIRSLTLCLKICEIEYLKNNSKNSQILLLLDDIFSELDKNRREYVIKLLSGHQSVITTTDKQFISDNLKNIKIINLEKNGQDTKNNKK